MISPSLPKIGLPAIEAALSVIKGDRLWLKFGHGRFVFLVRQGDGNNWQLHHTKLEISQDEAQAKGYSADVRSRSRSISLDARKDGLEQLLSISRNEDGGVFWLPAAIDADLPIKECITQADVLSCEIDNAERDEQLERYQWFERVSGLSYGLQLSSGSKSIHSHIFIDEPIAIDTVLRLRRLFVLCLLGDPAVTRQHQPMRFPGFYRSEKGNYQELLTLSEARYSLSEIEQGLQSAFTDLGWALPTNLSDELWADLQRTLKKDIPADGKRNAISQLLARGDDFYVEQAKDRTERQHAQQMQFAQKQLSGELNLFDAVAQVEQRLNASESFNAVAHDWDFSGHNHARGMCEWHPGSTNSAWLSQVDGKWVYHCPTCTNDKPISSFQYWLYNQRGVGRMPTGKDWANSAKQWLALHGVTVPEKPPQRQPAPIKSAQRISALLPEAKAAKPAPKPQTQAEWKAAQKLERDRLAYAKIAKLLGIENTIDLSEKDYKQQARGTFYEPLKKHLKYETRGELISGFAEQMKPNADGRSLIAYDCSQGTGKSNNALIPPALRVAKDGGRVLIFVPTRGLAREFKGRINERAGGDIAATHLDPKYYSAAIVVTCPESAYKFKGQKFDLIQIDEANEVLHRIESAELGNAGPQSLEAFRKLLASANAVAIATAAMSGWTLAAVQSIGGFTPDETQLQRRSRPATQMQIFEYGNFYQWLQRIIDALKNGQRVAIPTGSQGKGRAIDRILRAEFPNKSGLVIDGSATLETLRSRFLADPDGFLEVERPNWFIFSPVINSGVSIEGKHFDVQFEYATPHEGAQSISQRGERIRSSIGRDGAITERHIYFSQHGAPSLEAYPDAFDWQYWADELENSANAPMGAAAALAKALGAERAIDPIKQDALKFAGMRQNLPHFMAAKAFEIVYKKELLHEDWQRFGWEVKPVEKPDELEAFQIDLLKAFYEKVQIGLIQQQGRTLKKTKTRDSEGDLDEINNPFQAARAAKLQLEKLLGKDYLAQQNADFFTAWVADKSAANPGVRSVVRSQLVQIAISDPDCWQEIEHAKALKFLAGKPAVGEENPWHLGELPAAARDIELASIIARCPGVAEVVSGKKSQWTNNDPQVLAAGLYLIAHAKQISANTKHSGLIRGAVFSEQMAPAALFNKALGLVGYEPHKQERQGKGNRLNVYRLAVAADAISQLDCLGQSGASELKLFRAELKAIRAQTRRSIDEAAKSRIMAKALAWTADGQQGQIDAALAAIYARHPDLLSHGLSELGDGPQKGAGLQRELALVTSSPPPRTGSDAQNRNPLSDNYYDSSAWV
jgi:hypothetical protein